MSFVVKYKRWLTLIALVALFAAVRLPGLGRYVTTDEALWFLRSANFYLAVERQDWPATFQSEHPGVVTLWAGASAFLRHTPDLAEQVAGDVHDTTLLQLLENRGLNPANVLSTARTTLVLVHAAAFALLGIFAFRQLAMGPASIGLALLAAAPFLAAHQRLLHLDGLLASFMLLAVLAYWDYWNSRQPLSLLASALAAGLALLTKTPAWFLFPFILLLTLWQLRSERTVRSWLAGLAIAALWALLALVLLTAAFPAMWLAPLETVGRMLGYALGTAQGEFSGPVFFNGHIYPDGDLGTASWYFYPLAYLWRSTPLTLIGLGLALWKLKQAPASVRLLLAFALAFMLFMGLADKQFDRYLLPAMPALLLAAGWGWWAAAVAWRPQRQWAMLAAVIALQLGSAFTSFPYYLSYYNSVLRLLTPVERHMMIGWGEGLDQAAAYLNTHPGSVASWYSNSFNLMFPRAADDIPIALELSEPQLADLLAHDYLVIYVHQWQRQTPQNLLEALAGLQPVHTVVVDGIEYVRVYKLGP
ncbi:MAG: phospholipid carrier-dependent glycosyltransferase [Anaerolineales bacterium]|nr:phospholipid carrier-dependent glycosyltransferase [Anaerolineales bacterium]